MQTELKENIPDAERAKFARFRLPSRILFYGSFFVFAWGFAVPMLLNVIYLPAVLTLILLPAAGIYMLAASGGTMNAATFSWSPERPTVAPFFWFGAVGLAFLTIPNIPIISIKAALAAAFAIFIPLVYSIYRKAHDLRRERSFLLHFFTVLVIFCYSYGLMMALNCLPDRSVPVQYSARITGHVRHLSECDLTLSPWGGYDGETEVPVTRRFYDKAKVNSFVTVNVKKGLLRVPWYYLSNGSGEDSLPSYWLEKPYVNL